MKSARMIYRYLTAVFIADVLLQFFLAGAGVFRAGSGTAARESGTIDPTVPMAWLSRCSYC